MSQRQTDTDVLIVGAGPVGLFLANECARRGLRWRLVEAQSSQSEHSKALAIFPRTLEIFDMAGVVAPFLEVANRVTSAAVVSHGRTLANMRFTPEETPYSFIAMVPQNVTEKLLVDELARKGGAVEYETTFLSAVEDEDGVSVKLDRKGEPLNLRASFVVGCDGAHSPIRHLLNLPFEGAEYADSFLLADVETDETLPADQMQLCPNEAGPLAIFPMSSTRRRIVATIQKMEGETPSLEVVQRITAERGPSGCELLSMNWSSYFRIHHRHVGQLRVGRIFVAGDAAHIHSPFGGQGMNTGLQDVWNLAWKLDLVLRGRGGDELLDSYSAERIPVIKQVIDTTHMLTKAMGTPSKLAQHLRDAIIPMVSRLAPFQHAFVERLSELGVNYRGSSIVDGDGERFFDDSMRGGAGIRDRFLLFMDSETDSETKQVVTQFSNGHKDVIELRFLPGQKITLVRPDGYVAYSSQSIETSTLSAVGALLELQTGRVPETRGPGAEVGVA